MSIVDNIVRARSHVSFIIGLCLAASIAITLDTQFGSAYFSPNTAVIVRSADQTKLAAHAPLSVADIEDARVAWQYFDRNYNSKTGLVNSVDGFPSTTIWDQASYLLGMISAYRIGVISEDVFDQRLAQVLATLNDLPLFADVLPNKAYNTQSLMMTDYSNRATERGIGWSALDIARMTVPLNIILYDYPKHSALAAQLLTRWNFQAMLENGQLQGARLHAETNLPETIQEGRLGYEEYGARAVSLLGLDAMTASRYDDYIDFETVSGQEIAVDSRRFEQFGAPNYVVSEPYILMAIEFGLDREAQELAHRIYKAQETRARITGTLTAVSEDNINQEPYFLYNTVFANGQAWNTVSEDGTSYPDLRTVSTKAAFGWHALYQTDYTNLLMQEIERTKTPDRGWVSGLYEKDGSLNDVATANTNGIILEVLNYKANGPLLAARFMKDK
ncbi:MAG: hypothetical protein COB84_01575 [Rhodobacteraceae bacterium]|nr:MAG: hypothetical protein COB84_01575 [Paracoccaceae bacterium]